MEVDQQTLSRSLNIVGLATNLAGSFLLSVEAMRVSRVLAVSSSLGDFAKWIGDPIFRQNPLPLSWKFAGACAAFCMVSWLFAPYLILWTITPALFVVVFLVHRSTTWAARVSDDGYVALIGFLLLCAGSALQLAAIFSHGE